MIATMLNGLYKGIKLVPPELDSLVMAVFVDAGFTGKAYSLSQLRFIVTLMDKTVRPIIYTTAALNLSG